MNQKISIPFAKMHGAGNDFIIIDLADVKVQVDWVHFAQQICQRHTGIGADQLLLLDLQCTTAQSNPVRMRIYNSDGSTAQMCGNGVRCVGSYLTMLGKANLFKAGIMTDAGLKALRNEDGRIMVNMGTPNFQWAQIPVHLPKELQTPSVQAKPGELIPLTVGEEHFSATAVSMGNPHCVIFTSRVQMQRIQELGPKIERHPYFPERTNVMLAVQNDEHNLEVAHWERGAGLTLACGSGACATAAVALRRGMVKNPITIVMRGGALNIEKDQQSEELWLGGPTCHLFDGQLFWQAQV